jgi:uncharacterized protein (DUF1015 family)
MADVLPLRALRYDASAVGGLDRVVAPPYDVIDKAARAELAARSPHNVVHVDLPRAPDPGGDPYEHAGALWESWRRSGIVVEDEGEALWAVSQEYLAPDGRELTRHGFLARVRVEDYGAGRIRPHERTHPGPKDDRLRLTRATRTNLSPVFSLFPDPVGAAWAALGPFTGGRPWGTHTDADGTRHRLWPVRSAEAIEAVRQALGPAELLIADGHHRYETARAYAAEVGGDGPHRHVLMFLCSLSDPGLTVFPIHRLVSGLDDRRRDALRETVLCLFDAEPVELDGLAPPPNGAVPTFGYLDSVDGRPLRLVLRDPAVAELALAARPAPYRRLDTAVLEALVLRGALGMSDEDISHLNGLDYSNRFGDALDAVESGRAQAAFFLRPTPIELVRSVADSGESMPPKSTYFYPKIPTGLLFNPLA